MYQEKITLTLGPHKDLNKDLMVDENPLTETHPSTKRPFNRDLFWKKTLKKTHPSTEQPFNRDLKVDENL
jgi:hypothetical protein